MNNEDIDDSSAKLIVIAAKLGANFNVLFMNQSVLRIGLAANKKPAFSILFSLKVGTTERECCDWTRKIANHGINVKANSFIEFLITHKSQNFLHFCKRSMWTCLVCHVFHARNLKRLVQHLNTVHYGQPNVDILCGINGCVSRYKSCKGWCNHVIRKHKQAYAGVNSNNQTATVAEPHDISITSWVDNREMISSGAREPHRSERNAMPGFY